ncbi:DNA-processing protein DprA [Silvibacterium sp.]|uniref:DNA-processing protein DprA n=1 Tax=Silvibacterium sp. TaxID=1964179 RepID=UPI0039E561A3
MTPAPASHPVAHHGSHIPHEDERLAWLALTLTPKLGPRRILKAIERIGSATRVLGLRLTDLEGLHFPAESAQCIAEGRALSLAGEERMAIATLGGSFLCHADEAYPERLREIFDPPPVLWVRGNADVLQQPAIAVVGTRHPTPYGASMAEMLSRDLAQRGLIILSGMARGIDTCAHKGALAAGKPNIAIWGTGIDVVYPKENHSLAEKIVASGGAVLSEFPLGTFPSPPNFPRRNRILSGISVGVLVVEAAEYSGTRITARCALEQNRDVYAVPGNVTNKNSWGPNTLIKQGAKLTATWEDVWEDLPSQVRTELESRLEQKAGLASNDTPAASLFREEPPQPHEARLLSILRPDEALQIDEIMERLEAELSSSEVFTALFELELTGRIRQLPGKHYVRCL